MALSAIAAVAATRHAAQAGENPYYEIDPQAFTLYANGDAIGASAGIVVVLITVYGGFISA